MYSMWYPTQTVFKVKRIDEWEYNIMNKNFDPYVVRDTYYIGNAYLGTDTVYGADSKSLLNQFNAKAISQQYSDIFLSEYVCD